MRWTGLWLAVAAVMADEPGQATESLPDLDSTPSASSAHNSQLSVRIEKRLHLPIMLAPQTSHAQIPMQPFGRMAADPWMCVLSGRIWVLLLYGRHGQKHVNASSRASESCITRRWHISDESGLLLTSRHAGLPDQEFPGGERGGYLGLF